MGVSVKICGLTNYHDAALATDLGADYLGFIFAESPRQVDENQVVTILHKLEEHNLRHRINAVGVFVNEDEEIIKGIVDATGIDIVQLHGDETVELTRTYAFPWYKALRFSSMDSVVIQLNQIRWECQQILIDAVVPGMYGGTGKTVDTDIAVYARDKIRKSGRKILLAGGITPENVHQVMTAIQPDGIDISSGVEEKKGKKSEEKMRKLFKEIKRYTR